MEDFAKKEQLKRLEFVHKTIFEKKQKIEQALQELERLCQEAISIQKKIDEQDNGG